MYSAQWASTVFCLHELFSPPVTVSATSPTSLSMSSASSASSSSVHFDAKLTSDDVLKHVLSFISADDLLLSLNIVSRRFFRLCSSDALARSILKQQRSFCIMHIRGAIYTLEQQRSYVRSALHCNPFNYPLYDAAIDSDARLLVCLVASSLNRSHSSIPVCRGIIVGDPLVALADSINGFSWPLPSALIKLIMRSQSAEAIMKRVIGCFDVGRCKLVALDVMVSGLSLRKDKSNFKEDMEQYAFIARFFSFKWYTDSSNAQRRHFASAKAVLVVLLAIQIYRLTADEFFLMKYVSLYARPIRNEIRTALRLPKFQ